MVSSTAPSMSRKDFYFTLLCWPRSQSPEGKKYVVAFDNTSQQTVSEVLTKRNAEITTSRGTEQILATKEQQKLKWAPVNTIQTRVKNVTIWIGFHKIVASKATLAFIDQNPTIGPPHLIPRRINTYIHCLILTYSNFSLAFNDQSRILLQF